MVKCFRIYLFIFIVLTSFTCKLNAQIMPKSFQDDHVKFITELRDFFESYEGKEGKEFINQFSEEFWVSNF